MTEPVRLRARLPAPIGAVWRALTNAIEPYAGGRWSIGGGGPVGQVRDLRKGRKLQLQEDSGIATWELTDDETATRIR